MKSSLARYLIKSMRQSIGSVLTEETIDNIVRDSLYLYLGLTKKSNNGEDDNIKETQSDEDSISIVS